MRKLREPHFRPDAITTRPNARLMLALVLARQQIERYKQDRQAERQKAGQTRQATVA